MDVTVLNRQRQRRVDTTALRTAAETILGALDRAAAELTVTLVSDRRMRALNRDYRGLDRPTDVLSFGQEEETADGAPLPRVPGMPEVLGDVVLSTETAARQAPVHAPAGLAEDAALQRELTYLLLHGVLHLVGHTHDDDDDHDRMERERRRVWPLLDTWSADEGAGRGA